MTFQKSPPKHFQGLRSDLPMRMYHRNLPHWRQWGATYFVTFHLNDALPRNAIQKLAALRQQLGLATPPPHDEAALQERARRLATAEDKWLDAGHGSCLFRRPACREILQEALLFFANQSANPDHPARYDLNAFTIMPNHVHVLMRPLDDESFPLEKILQGWKSGSSLKINRLSGASGSIWFDESYDRIVRDSEHLWRCLQYIGNNGKKAGLQKDESARWVCDSWVEQGWGFED